MERRETNPAEATAKPFPLEGKLTFGALFGLIPGDGRAASELCSIAHQ
jgi:hypothetical protein